MRSFPDSERALRDAFPGLAARCGGELRRLAAEATRHELPEGAVVLREQQPHDTLFFVCEGEVALQVSHGGSAVRIGTLGRSRWLGELGFLAAGPSTAQVTTAAPTLLLSVSRAQLEGWLDTHPVLADAILAEILPGMAERLRTTREVAERGATPLAANSDRLPSGLLAGLRAFFGGTP